ncbi:competence-related pilin export protein ComGA [Alteribacillus persepolensis]|uniref:Competence-related pilin export protein ComGA n=1 Tax=Alteribacillus persepolensis TaxID=568899 RepID=A0A1G8CWK3_9BACI|nr:competence type IV pilus ATPase ComGA [Alteribacillus persepolensis]SDH49865.1 competence-related pilin export protein ComGA [Alteribacillus persepolensis]
MSNIEWESTTLIERALALYATDIHFHPHEKYTSLFFRLRGKLQLMQTLKKREAERLIAHFKFRAGMDIGEQRRPQSGSMTMKHTSLPVNLRFSTVPSYFHESLSIRILPQTSFLTLSSLSFVRPVINHFKQLLGYSHGLIIVTGPTGSGKTTTLYTLMKTHQRMYHSRVISIEDPIEIRSADFIQTQVNNKAGLTYAEMLKASLRHDPDLLMVGEIRDKETAELAIRAALTGHLVLTTMHAHSPQGAIQRLFDFGFTPQDLKETLRCIASQTLKQRYCPLCQQENVSPFCTHLGSSSRIALFDILSETLLQHSIDEPNHMSLSFSMGGQMKKGTALGLFKSDEERKKQ